MTLDELRLNIKWWDSKRWAYNLAVGLFGVIAIYDGYSRSDFFGAETDSFGIIFWAIGANIFYSLGILAELFDWYYLKNKLKIKKFRLFFFTVGILFSSFWTLWCGWLHFAKPHLW